MNEWNLKLIYPTESEWEKDFQAIQDDIKEFEALKGKLNTKEGFLAFKRISRKSDERISKLYTYANMKYDLNQKDDASKLNYQRIYSAYSDLAAKTAFITPEILENGLEKLEKILDEEPELEVLRYQMHKIFRSKDHYLDAKSEGIMANYNEALGGFNNLYDQLAVVDNRSKKVTLSDGQVLELTESNFQYYLGILPNQEDRRIVFEAIYEFYDQHKNTFSGIYNGIMQSELAVVKNRGYASILDSRLYSNAIPTKVYTSLVETARTSAKSVQRYYDLRKSFFKINELHTYDRFLNFSKSNVKYTYEKSKEMVLEACKSLGDDFYQHACRALEDGRVSVNSKDGKRTGAYSTSLYKEGSFILLNHNDNLDSAFTVAHEAGHSIHSLYANENQAEENANYTIFVAEIASTFNEQLFLDYVMEHSNDKNEKIVVLQQAIDNIISTFYRQTLFADYELQAHALVESGQPVTASGLCKLMEKNYLDYYGIDLNTERYKDCVWAYIPHFFHSPFYVYQYATSFAASLAIYEKVQKKERGALDHYLKMLSMGGCNYPVEIVKSAGVDLTTTEPFLAVVNRLDELVDELSELLEE